MYMPRQQLMEYLKTLVSPGVAIIDECFFCISLYFINSLQSEFFFYKEIDYTYTALKSVENQVSCLQLRFRQRRRMLSSRVGK